MMDDYKKHDNNTMKITRDAKLVEYRSLEELEGNVQKFKDKLGEAEKELAEAKKLGIKKRKEEAI